MNYQLDGHEYRHAVEEMLLHLLPAETPLLQECIEGDGCVSMLTATPQGVQITARVTRDGRTYESTYTSSAEHAQTNASTSEEAARLARRRVESELVQLSVYDAVVPLLAVAPVWGSLTGVRPAKLARSWMERGFTTAQVAERLRERFHVSAERTALTVRAAAVAQACKRTLEPRDVSIYVGIPFCPSRCHYCSFVSADVHRSSALIPPYVDALCAEIAMTGVLLSEGGYRVTTLYIGGGTPTTLSAAQLAQLMDTLRKEIDLSALLEYTVEAGRPDTITAEKLNICHACGVTRVSINPQSMNNDVLVAAGRGHSTEQVLESYALAREIGFDCINMDTIAGLEADTPARFARTMEILTALAPDNITVHTLAVKRGADLSDRAANVHQYDAVAQMLAAASEQLTASGFAPYYLYRQKFSAGGFENVGWSRKDKESLYNVYMMEELQTIVSLGAGAVSKRVEPATGRVTRYANPKYAAEYLHATPRIAIARRALLSNLF